MRYDWGPVAWWGVTDWWRHGPPRDVVLGSYVVFAAPLGRRGDRVACSGGSGGGLAGFSVPSAPDYSFYSGIWGMGRYTASCWAAFVPLGVWLSRRPLLQTPVVVSFALLQGMMFFLVQHQFGIL